MRLANPLDAEVPLLRRTLLPGLLDTARRNLSRGLTDLALFEIGRGVPARRPAAATAADRCRSATQHPGDASAWPS